MNDDQLEGIGLIVTGIGSLVVSVAEHQRGERLSALVAVATGLWIMRDGISKYQI
jgi:hypothetical protein